jgi:hypothetical protein
MVAAGIAVLSQSVCGSVQRCPDGTIETGRTVGRRQVGDGFLTTEDVRLTCAAVGDGGTR